VCEDKEYEYFKKWWKSKQEFWHSNMFSDRDMAYSAFLKGREYASQSVHAQDATKCITKDMPFTINVGNGKKITLNKQRL